MSNQESQYSIQGYNLVTLLKRLEAATSRLEDVTVFQEEISARTRGSADGESAEGSAEPTVAQLAVPAAPDARALQSESATPVTPISEDVPQSIKDFDDLLDTSFQPLVALSGELDAVIADQVGHFLSAFKEERKFLLAAAKSKKVEVTDPEFAEALTPINAEIEQIVAIKDKNRQSPFFSHLNTLAEGSPVLGWVVTTTPVSFIPEYKDASQFWSNRILKEYKDKDTRHVEWVKLYLKIFDDLKAYVKEHHTTGPTWNPQGVAFADALKQTSAGSPSVVPVASAAPAAAAPAAGGAPPPPPPPPPPPASIFEDAPKDAGSSGGNAGGINAVFASLNQGEAITKGLKKVDKSQMTHKNPELRAASAVPAAPAAKKPVPPKKPTSLSQKPAKKPARKELLDTKWLVENYEDTHDIVIEGEMHQSVFIGKCSNCTIQIKGKINALSLSECSKVGLVVDSLVSGVDIIKSTKFGVQVLTNTPMISIDQSDGGSIYLPASSLNTDIYTSSTTALNVNVPDGGEDGDFKEIPVPEQFKHSFTSSGKMQSTIVEHAG